MKYSDTMRIGTTGIVINEAGHVLLIQRNDSRTFAPPGGALDRNELPPQSAVREVREETGITVVPERLDGLYYWPVGDDGLLSFVFRCRPQSGTLTTSTESPQVRYAAPDALPQRMADVHRERVQRSLAHTGLRPFWCTQRLSWRTGLTYFFITNIVYRWLDLQRWLRRQPPYQPPPDWRFDAFAIVDNERGEILWTKGNGRAQWQLPGGEAQHREPPWEAAVRQARADAGLALQLHDLRAVYLHPDQSRLTFLFTAAVADSRGGQTADSAAACAYFAPGAEPEKARPQHRACVADSAAQQEAVVFRWLPPTGSEHPDEQRRN